MKTTIKDIMKMKTDRKKISMLTAYDFYMGKLVDEAGIDIILVGDSLGMVIQGQKDTLPVTLEEMIYHTKLVDRGRREALLVTDLPFMSFQVSVEKALTSAGRIMKESGAQAVKLEGGQRVVPQIKAMTEAGIPVMGHLGLTPQSVNQFGGFKVQGQEKKKAQQLISDAQALEEAGIFALVLETVPHQLASIITEKVSIPTIGIGAGPDCDGQVLVLHDLLGVDEEFKPRFARQYANLNQIIKKAVREYIDDIKEGSFPTEEESFSMEEDILRHIREEQ
ncbi:MAG: 3-methyl-2-oxobutanoate hydroxymethyltransferase [Halanaerobiaceae bacterium]